jgi:hypothetical protein
LNAASTSGPARVKSLESLIRGGKVPRGLSWRPELCMARGKTAILVHPLVAQEFPSYLETALAQLRKARFKNTHVLLLARDITTEAGDENPPERIPAHIVALRVADRALTLGCALAFESEGRVFTVFSHGYKPPALAASGEETGHIPRWLYSAVAGTHAFSPYLKRSLEAFGKEYAQATKRKSITNDREAEILLKFAKRVTRGDVRLFFPLGQLSVLREYEMAKANSRTRDHFFHTFNNLLLGFYILGKLFGTTRYISDLDYFINGDASKAKMYPWESLWFLTCTFHDPAYIAEKFWGTVRFTYGVEHDQGAEDGEIPASVKQNIRDMWETKFVGPRADLNDLYKRTIRKWIPPTLQKPTGNTFDTAIQKAYFDGTNTSHSLVSGLRLINLCRTQDVPRGKNYDSSLSLVACEIAALSMMFHDQRCRGILQTGGIPPIAFEHLPYASLLMFVDALQDDRRDISLSRFRKNGILQNVSIAPNPVVVRAVVDLREAPVRGWAPRIAEYEAVMAWINSKSSARFEIEYRAQAGL